MQSQQEVPLWQAVLSPQPALAGERLSAGLAEDLLDN